MFCMGNGHVHAFNTPTKNLANRMRASYLFSRLKIIGHYFCRRVYIHVIPQFPILSHGHGIPFLGSTDINALWYPMLFPSDFDLRHGVMLAGSGQNSRPKGLMGYNKMRWEGMIVKQFACIFAILSILAIGYICELYARYIAKVLFYSLKMGKSFVYRSQSNVLFLTYCVEFVTVWLQCKSVGNFIW